ncbi:sensor histidine kinase [Rhodococcus qingshengii]|uniref:sensor histidine kinase n=1 Tax=Rhodococcus qingshengii TaxID=334542 RepID=UPI001BECBE10|nr:histidine kinase [Rhodococcus qingshengii]MBT2276276.1 two-component sensor histidine kinase [Rhodococcus qingshengii]
MQHLSHIREGLRHHSMWADGLLAIGVLCATLVPFVDRSMADERGFVFSPLLLVALVAACGCLVFRRRAPWAVWAVTATLGLIAVAVSRGPTPIYAPSVVALYTAVVLTGPTRSVLAATTASAVLPAAVILSTGPRGLFDAIAFGMTPWSVLAAMTALAVRAQREAVAAANERARAAEATREEEAQRRVTEERLRIARELHDVVAHHISAINVQAGVAGVLIDKNPDGAAEAMSHVRRSSQAVLRELPTLVGLLRTSHEEIETSPLPQFSDIEQLVDNARSTGQRVIWQTTGIPCSLTPATDLTAYRIVQEAMTNAAKYGDGPVTIRIAYGPEDLSLDISNPIKTRPTGRHSGQHGLTGMRERVLAAGGSLRAAADETNTWVVHATFPTQRTDPGADTA